jgi:hypothetical protein
MDRDRQLTLHFIDGSRIAFDFPEQTADETARQMKIAQFLASKHLIIEADGAVLIFPVANIKYIALAGVPLGKGSSLPRGMIRGARVRS